MYLYVLPYFKNTATTPTLFSTHDTTMLSVFYSAYQPKHRECSISSSYINVWFQYHHGWTVKQFSVNIPITRAQSTPQIPHSSPIGTVFSPQPEVSQNVTEHSAALPYAQTTPDTCDFKKPLRQQKSSGTWKSKSN